MEFRQLQFFLQICKDCSFTKAAEHLYITQQGLSNAVARLEEELNLTLFVRDKRGVVLTEAGMHFKERARVIVNEVEKTKNEMLAYSKTESGIVHIVTAYAVLGDYVGNVIERFRHEYPNIHMEINELPDILCEKAVLNREADIGFSIGPIDDDIYDHVILERRKLCLLVNRKHPLAQQKTISISDLEDEEIIIVNEYFKTYHNFLCNCRKAGFEARIVYKAGEISAVHNLSRRNKGIGITVDFIARDMDYVECCAIPFADNGINWDVCMFMVKDSPFNNMCQQSLFDYVKDNYSLTPFS